MARYSRRSGPAANFELTAVAQTIPGMTIERFYDDGELLVMATMRYFNGTAGVGIFLPRILIDGIVYPPVSSREDTPSGFNSTHTFAHIFPITRGRHLIELQGIGSAAAGDHVVFDSAVLTVIQLPLWDRDIDIT